MESKDSKKPVFMMREPGMPFAEFKNRCIQAFREAGYFDKQETFSTNPPDEGQMRLHKMYEQGLEEDLQKANQNQPLPAEPCNAKPPKKN